MTYRKIIGTCFEWWLVKSISINKKQLTVMATNNYNSLEKFAKNLVADAKAGKLDPVIGRDDEIRRVL